MFIRSPLTLYVFVKHEKVDGLAVEDKKVRNLVLDDYKWALQPSTNTGN